MHQYMNLTRSNLKKKKKGSGWCVMLSPFVASFVMRFFKKKAKKVNHGSKNLNVNLLFHKRKENKRKMQDLTITL